MENVPESRKIVVNAVSEFEVLPTQNDGCTRFGVANPFPAQASARGLLRTEGGKLNLYPLIS